MRTLSILSLLLFSAAFFVPGVSLGIDRSQIQFSGNETFSDQELIEKLYKSSDFLLGNHHLAPETKLPEVITDCLMRGYRSVGFPHAKVNAALSEDLQSLKVQISEGTRYRKGVARIVGNVSAIDSKLLAARLMSPYPDAGWIPTYMMQNGNRTVTWKTVNGESKKLNDPVWKQGTPAPFGIDASYESRVKAAFKDVGFSQATFKHGTGFNKETGLVDLVVKIEAEGPSDSISDIIVTGTKRNTPRDVVNFLGLRSGMACNRRLISLASEKLWSSGRFLKQQVRLEVNKSTGRPELLIDVEEFPFVPLLGEPLSKDGQDLMAACQWASIGAGIEKDLVLELNQDGVQYLTVHSGDGGLIQMHDKNKGVVLALIIDGNNFLAVYSPLKSKFHGSFPLGKVAISLSPSFGCSTETDKLIQMTINMGMSTGKRKGGAPIAVTMPLSPARFLGFAYHPLAKIVRDGSSLHIERDGKAELSLDLERQTFLASKAGAKLEEGRYLRERDRLFQMTASYTNAYRDERPIASFFEYILDPQIAASWNSIVSQKTGGTLGDEDTILQLAALRRLFQQGVFTNLEQFMLNDSNSDKDHKFHVPAKRENRPAVRNPFVMIAADALLQNADMLFADKTWPKLVTHETGFFLQGHRENTQTVLQMIRDSKHRGSLCKGTVAVLVSYLSSELRFQFAVRALQNLDAEHFESDYRELMQGTLGEMLQSTIKAIHTMEPEEIEAVAKLIDNEKLRALFRKVYLARETGIDIEDGAAWFPIVKEDLEAWLRGMLE